MSETLDQRNTRNTPCTPLIRKYGKPGTRVALAAIWLINGVTRKQFETFAASEKNYGVSLN